MTFYIKIRGYIIIKYNKEYNKIIPFMRVAYFNRIICNSKNINKYYKHSPIRL